MIILKKKLLKVLGIIIAFILCFVLHFLYKKILCFVTSIISPVNERIFEHMKILFSSTIFSGIIQKIIIMIKKEKINNICFSNFIGAISSIPIFLIMFLPIYLSIGENLIITIILMLITIIISEIISYKIMNKKDLKFENKTIFFVIIVYTLFGIFTYFPIKNDFFKDFTNSSYGINN